MKAKDIYQVLFVLFWCVNVLLHVCLCSACVLGTLKVLELELQTVIVVSPTIKPESGRTASALLLTAEPSFQPPSPFFKYSLVFCLHVCLCEAVSYSC